MLTDTAFRRQSLVLNSLRIPATLLVIFSHCTVITNQGVVQYSWEARNLWLFFENLLWSFGPIAVSLFALISGYYFFYKYENYSLKDYLSELRKRSRSLYLPFVLWNIITWFAILCKNEIALRLGFSPGFNELEYKLAQSTTFIDCLTTEINTPLWYVKSIIYLSIASPLIYLLVRYTKYVGLIALMLFYIGVWGPYLDLHHHTVTYFCLGAFLGYYKLDIIQLIYRGRWLSYATGWLYCYFRTFGSDIILPSGTLQICLLLSVVSLINLSSSLYSYYPKISKWLIRFNAASFFMYATHTIIFINLTRGTLYSLIPWDNDWEKLIVLFLTSLVVPFSTYYSYKLLSIVSPRLSTILSGGRG